MSNCINCDKETESQYASRCIACKIIKRKLTSKANKDKYQYHKQPKARYKVYKAGALRRGYSFDLTEEDFKCLFNKQCYYCGDTIEGIGLDRKDNSIGYTKDNTVTCCTTCNFMKHKLSDELFINKSIQISRLHTVREVD